MFHGAVVALESAHQAVSPGLFASRLCEVPNRNTATYSLMCATYMAFVLSQSPSDLQKTSLK